LRGKERNWLGTSSEETLARFAAGLDNCETRERGYVTLWRGRRDAAGALEGGFKEGGGLRGLRI